MTQYTVIQAIDENEISSVFKLWQRNLHLSYNECKSKYNWFYISNPFRSGLLWLMQDKPGNFIGTAGLGFRNFFHKGAIFTGAITADFAINKEHRTLGPAILIQKHLSTIASDNNSFLYAFPNQNASIVFQKVGYTFKKVFPRYVKILQVRPYIQTILKSNHFSSILERPLNWYLRNYSKIKYKKLEYCCLESITEKNIPQNFLSEMSNHNFIFGIRDLSFIKWRYEECPTKKYYFFITYKDQNMCGLIIFYVRSNLQACIVDIIVSNNFDSDLSGSSLKSFELYCIKTGYASISISQIGVPQFDKILDNCGYSKREPERSIFFNKNNLEHINFENFFWTMGDEDNN